MTKLTKYQKQKNRTLRVRRKIRKRTDRLRLSIFRSAKNIYAQIIDDQKGETLVAVGPKDLPSESGKKSGINKSQKAREMGKILAQKAKKAKIEKVFFDRGGYRFHGRVREFAEGVREEGLNF